MYQKTGILIKKNKEFSSKANDVVSKNVKMGKKIEELSSKMDQHEAKDTHLIHKLNLLKKNFVDVSDNDSLLDKKNTQLFSEVVS